MNIKEKFDDIKLSEINEKTRDNLVKISKATKEFTIKSDKAEEYINAVYAKIKAEKPSALRSSDKKVEPKKPEPKKTHTSKPVAKKTPVAKKPEPTAPKPTKTQIKATKVRIDALKLALANDPLLQNLGKTDKERDSVRTAKVRGRRVSRAGWKNQYGKSKGGRVYYENRENRSDRKAPEFTSGYPYLEHGGHILDADGKYVVKVFTEQAGSITEKMSKQYRDKDSAVTFAMMKKPFLGKGEYIAVFDKDDKIVYRGVSMKSKGGYIESGKKLYEMANNMSDSEFQEAYRNLSEKEKDIYDKLNNDFENGGEVETILTVPKYMRDEIEESINLGYDELVVGMISKNRKGVLLVNDNYEVRGTYDMGLKNYIENIIANHKKTKSNGGYMAKGGEINTRMLNKKIKDWYIKSYPTDDLGEEINDTITFKSFWAYTKQGYDAYNVLNVGDSVVRERVEQKLSEILGEQGRYMAKGGELKNATYVPNRNINKIGLKLNSKNVEVSGNDILDGIYLKKSSTPKTKGIVVTSIKDIPNFQQRLDEGKITYRGLGMGKKSDDFYKIAGEGGTAIKVDGKEYLITDTEWNTFARGADGKLRVKFSAPSRIYEYGGELSQGDINKKVNKNIKQYLEYGKDRGERLYVLREIFKEALTDANFSEFNDKVDEIFNGSTKFVVVTNAKETEQLLFDVGQEVANTCNWDRFKIQDAMIYTCSMNGYSSISPKINDLFNVTTKKELKYFSKNKVKYVLVKNESKSQAFNSIYDIYESKDVYNGAYFFEKGGELKNAKYFSKNKVVMIGDDWKLIDKVNGAWVKKSASPIGEIEKSDLLDAIENNSLESYFSSKKSSNINKFSQTRIRKGSDGWKAKTTLEDYKGYDWEIDTMKSLRGTLISMATGGKLQKENGYTSFSFVLFQDPRVTLMESKPTRITDKVVEKQHEEALKVFFEKVDAKLDKKMAKGGELEMGIKTEMKEHGMSKKEATKTAKDHLKEHSNYYTKMKSVGLKKGGAVKGKLPSTLDKYFTKNAKTKRIPLSKLIVTREREDGIKNAEENLRKAYSGEIEKRSPITIKRKGAMYEVLDGNSTVAVAKKYGWKTIYANVKLNEVLSKSKGSRIFDIAKQIRKEGESWQNAVKRAGEQLK
jgi:hypothetical protein